MKAKILLLFLIISSCSSSEQDDTYDPSSEYQGSYQGLFTKNIQTDPPTGNGTIYFTVYGNGSVLGGYDVINLSYFELQGMVDGSGNIVLEPVGTQVGYAATFTGVITDDLTVSGTWVDESRNWNGVFVAD